MNREEQLKQAIEDHFIFPESKIGAEIALTQPSILRHADPKVMDDAGWFNKSKLIPETAGLFFAVHCECGWIGSSEELLGGGQIADTGDYGDSYCPSCGTVEPSEADELTIEDYKNGIKLMTKIIVGLRDDVEKNYLEKQAGWVREDEEMLNNNKAILIDSFIEHCKKLNIKIPDYAFESFFNA